MTQDTVLGSQARRLIEKSAQRKATIGVVGLGYVGFPLVLHFAEALASFDCVVLVTDHDAFDYELIGSQARLLVDTRGRYPAPRPNLVRA
jgi:UDP-N-acetyl-D-mannosaminuronate dehydrogenase